MDITVVNLFTEDLSKKIDLITATAKKSISQSPITHESTHEQLVEAVELVISNIWRFGTDSIYLIEVDKKPESIVLDAGTASRLGLPFTISRNTVDSLKVTYYFNIVGDEQLLECSNGGYSGMTFTGNQTKGKLEIHYYLKATPTDETIEWQMLLYCVYHELAIGYCDIDLLHTP